MGPVQQNEQNKDSLHKMSPLVEPQQPSESISLHSRWESALSKRWVWILTSLGALTFTQLIYPSLLFAVLLTVPFLIMGLALVSRQRLEWVLDQLEITCQSPLTTERGELVNLDLLLKNPTSLSLYGLSIAIRTPYGLSESVRLNIAPQQEGSLRFQLACSHFNAGHVWGIELKGIDGLGLVLSERHIVTSINIKVLPKSPRYSLPSTHQSSEALIHRATASYTQSLGQEGEFRELRPYQPSDGARRVAWRASARRGELVTQSLEQSFDQRYLFALDLSSIMRVPLGLDTRVDLALDLLPQWIRELGHQDCALVAFDHRLLYKTKVTPAKNLTTNLANFTQYATQPLDADCVAETREELWARASEYLYWSTHAQTKRWSPQNVHLPGPFSTHPLTHPYRIEVTRTYLSTQPLSLPLPDTQELDEGEHDLLRRYCHSVGITCSPTLPRTTKQLNYGLQSVFNYAQKKNISHLVILSHSLRLGDQAGTVPLHHWLRSRRALSWVQVGSLHKRVPKELTSLGGRFTYRSIPPHHHDEGETFLSFRPPLIGWVKT